MRRVLFVVLAVAGCSHAPVAEPAAPGWKLLSASPGTEEIQVRSDIHMRRATVTATAVRGPDLDLRRTDGSLEGTSYLRRGVELRQQGSEILGQVGAEDWGLRLSPDGTETRVTGVVAGKASTFWLSPARIRGAVGMCSFDLVWSASVYSGGRTCGPASDNIVIQIPAALSSWTDPQVAALLGVLLQRE